MVCLELKSGTAGWKAQTNPLSYGGINSYIVTELFQNLAKDLGNSKPFKLSPKSDKRVLCWQSVILITEDKLLINWSCVKFIQQWFFVVVGTATQLVILPHHLLWKGRWYTVVTLLYDLIIFERWPIVIIMVCCRPCLLADAESNLKNVQKSCATFLNNNKITKRDQIEHYCDGILLKLKSA